MPRRQIPDVAGLSGLVGVPGSRARDRPHPTSGGRSRTLETSGVLGTLAHQGRDRQRQYAQFCEVWVRDVGPEAQEVVTVPDMRDGAHQLDVVPAW